MNLNYIRVNLKIVLFVSLFYFSIASDALHQRYVRDGKLAAKDPKTVVQEKCDEYAAARYHNITTPGVLKGDDSLVIRELDCLQEYPHRAGVYSVKEKEYAHLAFLGTGKKLEDVDWYGSGSLISDRFVLGAASREKDANWVALGLLNESNITADKLNKNVFKIKRTHLHPEYNASFPYNDIALYELERVIMFTPTIRPTCLHISEDIPSSVHNLATVAGWGQVYSDETEMSVLRKGKVDFIESKKCVQNYANDERLKHGFDNKSMICAGNLIEDDITCVAQSGGPLQIPIPFKPCMWSQVGITSHGSSICDDNIPTVYTKVSHYLSWIQNIVWPQ